MNEACYKGAYGKKFFSYLRFLKPFLGKFRISLVEK
jgi:hypothetical protein